MLTTKVYCDRAGNTTETIFHYCIHTDSQLGKNLRQQRLVFLQVKVYSYDLKTVRFQLHSVNNTLFFDMLLLSLCSPQTNVKGWMGVLAKEILAVPKDLCWPHHCFLR